MAKLTVTHILQHVIYIYGGYLADMRTVTNQLAAYNISAGQWSVVEPRLQDDDEVSDGHDS